MNIKITKYVDVIIQCKKFQEVIEIRDEKFEKSVLFFLLAHGLYMQEHKRELLGVTIFKQQASKVEQLEIGIVMTFKEA